jgi:hypothetical protein
MQGEYVDVFCGSAAPVDGPGLSGPNARLVCACVSTAPCYFCSVALSGAVCRHVKNHSAAASRS